MKRLAVMLCGLWALGLVGCGGDALCERWDDARQGAVDKIGSCSGLEASAKDEGATCEGASDRCPSEDAAKLERYFACLDGVSTCKSGEELAFLGAQAACSAQLNGLSSECWGALGVDVAAVSGRLKVELSGPKGFAPRVTLKGPGGYTKQLSGSSTLAGLAPGLYTLEAPEVRTLFPVGEEVIQATVTPGSVTVVQGQEVAVTVRYAVDPRTPRLWKVTNYANAITGWDPSVLATAPPASAFAEPSVTLRAQGLRINRPQGFARDPAGDVWMANCQDRQVVKVRAADLLQSGAPVPVVGVDYSLASASTYVCPGGLAFDAEGTLWVSLEQSLLGYTAQQLAQGGGVLPAFHIQMRGSFLLGLAFDGAGNLWAGSVSREVLMLRPAQLRVSGALLPARSLRALDATLEVPTGLAFVGGDLWVTDSINRHLVRFSAEQVEAGGTVTSATVLSAPEAMWAPHSLAVDAGGNLWVGAGGSDSSTSPTHPGLLVRFNAAELRRTGRVLGSPHVVLSEGGGLPHYFYGLLFLGGDLLVGGNFFSTLSEAHVVRLSSAQLTASGTPTPVAGFGASAVAFDSPESLAFDAQGALWVASCNTRSVVKYPRGTWGVPGRPTPAVTLRPRDVSCPAGLAFDLQGNLWVGGFHSVERFSASRLQGPGEVEPDVTLGLRTDPSTFNPVQSLAFDTANTLWVARVNGTLESFAASARGASGTPAPTVRIELGVTQNSLLSQLIFEPSGALLLSLPASNQVLRYTPEQLIVSGAPAPRVLTVPDYPVGLALDRQGHLWVSTSTALVRLAPADLLQSGTPVPKVRVHHFSGWGRIAFSPALP